MSSQAKLLSLTSPNHPLNGTTTGLLDFSQADPLRVREVVTQSSLLTDPSCLPPSLSSTAVDQPLLASDVSLTSSNHPSNGTTTGVLASSYADSLHVGEVITPSCLLPSSAYKPLLGVDVSLTFPNLAA